MMGVLEQLLSCPLFSNFHCYLGLGMMRHRPILRYP